MLIIGIAGTILGHYIIKRNLLRYIRLSKTVASHIKELESKFKDMPFIYKGMEGDIVNDFVEVTINPLDLHSLKVASTNKSYNQNQYNRLQHSKKILLLGNAGVGKTTFQRHTILMLIRKMYDPRYLLSEEKPIPFYVPLRAVDNREKFPILRYILRNSGFKVQKLIRLERKGKFFLFLDGYDEIPFANPEKSERNYVQEELNFVMSTKNLSIHNYGFSNQDYKTFYEQLMFCRVWLTSRREFFEKFPIMQYKPDGTSSLKAVEIGGIGSNRLKLIKTIFDRYKRRSETYQSILNEEYFIQIIDDTEDFEIREISYNPLFLTVMCYIYAMHAIESVDCEIALVNTFYQLITECIKLLLGDLDETKVRELPKAERLALIKRRGTYLSEKEVFLRYFAFELFVEEKGIFDLEYINDKIKNFFTDRYDSPYGEKIIRELSKTDSSYPNFSLQLIFSGIFIIVDKNKDMIFYDFPHRRFREVLACEYITEPDHYEYLLKNIHKAHLNEFLNVFYRSSAFKNESLQAETLRSILYKSKKNNNNSDYYKLISYNLTKLKPHINNQSEIISNFLFQCLNSSQEAVFHLSTEILKRFKPGHDFIDTLVNIYQKCVEKKTAFRLSLCGYLLFHYNKPLLKELLQNSLQQELKNTNILPTIFQYVLMVDWNILFGYIEKIRKHTATFHYICYVISICYNEQKIQTRSP